MPVLGWIALAGVGLFFLLGRRQTIYANAPVPNGNEVPGQTRGIFVPPQIVPPPDPPGGIGQVLSDGKTIAGGITAAVGATNAISSALTGTTLSGALASGGSTAAAAGSSAAAASEGAGLASAAAGADAGSGAAASVAAAGTAEGTADATASVGAAAGTGAGVAVAGAAVAVAAVAVLAVVATGIGQDSYAEQEWRANQSADYYFGPAIQVMNPYSGKMETFGGYTGPPPIPVNPIPAAVQVSNVDPAGINIVDQTTGMPVKLGNYGGTIVREQ
jgi:hypothetical protein